jgi:hypothetical protein
MVAQKAAATVAATAENSVVWMAEMSVERMAESWVV